MGAVSLDMLVCGRASQPDLAGRQHARLRALLAAAVRGSGIYRERLKGKVPEMLRLRDLPLVSKRELMGNFSSWVTDPDVKLPDLRAFMADPRRIGEAYLNKYLVWESSGTSHEPCVFVQDARARCSAGWTRCCWPNALHLWARPPGISPAW
jgi:phenylacetate-coenzyme A ligase PaaK-like adenylate-forming protein